MLKASDYADAPAQTSRDSHRNIEVVIERYLARREATNSARNAKPLFTNIEKEQRDLAIRQRQFKAEIRKAMEKLGDMSQFQKYLKRRKPVKAKELVVEVQPYSLTVVKASMTPNTQRAGKRRLFLTSTGAADDLYSLHRRTKTALPSTRRPQTTKSSSSGYKSTPMHQDPQYKFRLKSAFSERVNVSSQLSLQLDNVVSKCGEAEQQFSETKREAASFDSKNAHIRHRSLEDISDMLESLHVEGSAENFEEAMRRKRVGRHVDHSVLAEAGQAKSSFLASSEFVAKYAHKGIWRFDTLSLTRHVDKLINSLPVTRGLFYAVAKGRRTGVFVSWPECQVAVDRFSGAVYKVFASLEEAQAYLHSYRQGVIEIPDSDPSPQRRLHSDSEEDEPPTEKRPRDAPLQPRPDAQKEPPVTRTSPHPRELVYLYSDGACQYGRGGAGFVIKDSEMKVICSKHHFIGRDITNNVAEYMALILGLKECLSRGLMQVVARADSNLVVQQTKGDWKVSAKHLETLCEEARRLASQFTYFHIEHVYRESNTEADALSKKALGSDTRTERRTRSRRGRD